MKKNLTVYLVLFILQCISVNAQDLTGLISDSALAYDFWGNDDKDKEIFIHQSNVGIVPFKQLPIDSIYSYDYKNKTIRFMSNNSNCCMKLTKECNKKVKKFLEKYSIPNPQGDELNKIITEKSRGLNTRYQRHNDLITNSRKLAEQEKKRQKAIEDSIRSKTHIKFMGIELDQFVDFVMLDLKKKGFDIIDVREDGYIMSGKFMNRKALITLHATPKSNLIYMVNVFFDEKKSWYSLKSEFLDIVKSYRTKYKCIDSGRSFLEPYYEGDGYEMQGVSVDKCFYFDIYEADGGNISVEIIDLKSVRIKYKDTINFKLNEKETISRNLDDI